VESDANYCNPHNIRILEKWIVVAEETINKGIIPADEVEVIVAELREMVGTDYPNFLLAICKLLEMISRDPEFKEFKAELVRMHIGEGDPFIWGRLPAERYSIPSTRR
jgi:hypothetical protein